MRIAQIASIAERVPPKKYGGTERVIYALTEELVHRGHQVTLFASGDSLTSAELSSSVQIPLSDSKIIDPYGLNPLALQNIGEAYMRQNEFDIIHDHNWLISLPTANLSQTPVVMTIHGSFDLYNRKLFESMDKIHYVSISKSQKIPLPNLPYAGTVYHGLNMETYPFSEEHDGYLLFVGRISMEKGVHFAIDVAQYLNKPLIIAAKLDPQDVAYYKQYIEPRLSEQIRWIGEVEEEERNRLMSKALCFLHPVTWREPFGVTLIEAMACGCPVVAFNRGAIPEIVKDGKTGFVVEDVNEMIIGVENIGKIKRETCHSYALKYFNAKRMTDAYETIYTNILKQKLTKEGNHQIKELPKTKENNTSEKLSATASLE